MTDSKKIQDIIQNAKAPLKDAAAVNATRFAIGNALKDINHNTSFWSGGRTKQNRISQNYKKDHWIDAACVGQTGENVYIPTSLTPLNVKAEGRGSRQKCRVDKYGFPRTSPKREKRSFGFQTGDLIVATVTKGKKEGKYVGRVAVRSTGNFNITIGKKVIQGIHYRYCKLIQRIDGYSYVQTNQFNCGAASSSP